MLPTSRVSRWARPAVLAASVLLGNALAVAPVRAQTAPVCPTPGPGSTVTVPPAPPLGPAPLTPGALTLTSTFNSIGVEVKFSGDGNANAEALLAFKKSSDTAWRDGLPMWRTPDAFYGSALLLEAGTNYDVRATLKDGDGVVGQSELRGTKATRTDAIPPASALAPTHFVSPTGSDATSNPGTSPTTPWQTLDKALRSAPADAVVQVAPGYYAAPAQATVRPTALTLKAELPAVDDAQHVINPGLHSVIDSGLVSGPSGATEQVTRAPWHKVTPDGDPSHPVWVWRVTDARLPNIDQLGYAATRAAEPRRVAHWARDGLNLCEPAGWTTKLYTNKTYNYGFFAYKGVDKNGVDASGLYVRLPGDRNPNAVYVTAGANAGLQFTGSKIRVSGFELRQFDRGIEYGPAASGGIIDHNQLMGNFHAIVFTGRDGAPAAYAANHVVEHNRITDTSLWSAHPDTDFGIPWSFIKRQITEADGTTLYKTSRVGGKSESTAIAGKGGARQVVVRHNVIDGTFNGVMPSENSVKSTAAGDFRAYHDGWTDRYSGQDMDVHDNVLRHISDDAFEPEGHIINMRVWRNRITEASVVLSTAPLEYGPVYLFRNEGWCLGPAGVPLDASGNNSYGGKDHNSAFFKFSGRVADANSPVGRVFALHNTLTADPECWAGRPVPQVKGGGRFEGNGPDKESMYLRNNVLNATNEAFEIEKDGGDEWDETSNRLSTSAVSRGLDYCGKAYKTEVATYRADYEICSHRSTTSTVEGDFVTRPLLANAAGGNLALPLGSPLIDLGVIVNNVSDLRGVNYRGTQPDVGAREH